MKEIIVKNQKELDNLSVEFKEYTRVLIQSEKTVTIYVNKKYINCTVVARGNSSVVARGNSSVEAWENSSVVAWENSSVAARGNSSVEAWGNSSVVAWENSSVVARGNSSVEAWGNSSVVARGNSSVVAWENSSVAGFEFSFILILSAAVLLKKLRQYCIVRLREKCKIESKDRTVKVIDHTKIELKHDKKSFIELYDLETKDKKVILYKSVHPETLCDFRTGNVKYEGIVICPDFDPSNDRECGGGLHLCAKPSQALSFNQGQLLKCEVDLKDIVVYPKNIEKVRCKKVKVLGKCNIKGELT